MKTASEFLFLTYLGVVVLIIKTVYSSTVAEEGFCTKDNCEANESERNHQSGTHKWLQPCAITNHIQAKNATESYNLCIEYYS